MLRFFRKIRQLLLTENRFSKYLLYAVGEILLVVFGILIALQVNNWNERIKDRDFELQALKNLKEELERNSKEFNRVHEMHKSRFPGISRYLDRVLSDSYENGETTVIAPDYPGRNTVNISNSVLNSLIVSGEIKKISNDSLKEMLVAWPEVLDNYKDQENYYVNKTWYDFDNYKKSRIPAATRWESEDTGKSNMRLKYTDSMELNQYYMEIVDDLEYINNIKNINTQTYILIVSGDPVNQFLVRLHDMLTAEISKLDK